MMEIHDWFFRLCSNRGAGGSLRGAETVQTEQVPVLGEHNVFLELVSPKRTEVPEIGSSPNLIDLVLPGIVGLLSSVRIHPGVNCPRLLIEPVGDRTWEKYGDDQADEHLDSEENEAKEERGIFPGRKSPNEGDVRHVSGFAAVLRSVHGSGEERRGRWWQ